MRILITGSSGHLGEALVRVLRGCGHDVIGIDTKPDPHTDYIGSITDQNFVRTYISGVDAVLHTATLHKPHVATHSRQDFVDVNISGTLTLLEAARDAGVGTFVLTSTTSAFGDALRPKPGQPAAWITEDTRPVTKNIYGATKLAAEDLCWLAHQRDGMNIMILRTSRFFPEEQDDKAVRTAFSTENSQIVEFLHRRVDIEDVVSAHLLAAQRAPALGFGKFIISATTPFSEKDCIALRTDAAACVRHYVAFDEVFTAHGWSMPSDLDRVYVNTAARSVLGWRPAHDFSSVLTRIKEGGRPLSNLAYTIGPKGYHDQVFKDGPFPVEE